MTEVTFNFTKTANMTQVIINRNWQEYHNKARLLALKQYNYNPIPQVKKKNRELKQQMSGVKNCDRKGGPKDTGSKNHSNKRATECLEGAVT